RTPRRAREGGAKKGASGRFGRGAIFWKTADGGGNMMLRMPNALTLSSQAKSMSVVTRTGQAIVAAYLPMLFRMAGLDRLAQMANQAIEGFILGHGNMPRPRKIDCQFVDDRRRPATP